MKIDPAFNELLERFWAVLGEQIRHQHLINRTDPGTQRANAAINTTGRMHERDLRTICALARDYELPKHDYPELGIALTQDDYRMIFFWLKSSLDDPVRLFWRNVGYRIAHCHDPAFRAGAYAAKNMLPETCRAVCAILRLADPERTRPSHPPEVVASVVDGAEAYLNGEFLPGSVVPDK